MLGHSPPGPVFLHSGYSRKCSTSWTSIALVDVSFNAFVAGLSVTRTLCLLVGEQYQRNMQFQSSTSKPYPKEVLSHEPGHGFVAPQGVRDDALEDVDHLSRLIRPLSLDLLPKHCDVGWSPFSGNLEQNCDAQI